MTAIALIMKPRVLITTTSFQDTPGDHHRLLQETGWEIVTARGPLNEADTLALMGISTVISAAMT